MDIVYIRGLQVETVIGIYDWERSIKQVVNIDLDMAHDIHRAAQTDAIEDTLDYKAVTKRIISFVEQSQFLLIEALAEQITTIVRNEFHVPWVRLRLGKPGAVRGAVDVGVEIERGVRT